MGYYYEPLAIVDEETYDAAMWNEVESQKHLNDNMLMPDFDEVDEQAWDEAVDAVLEDASYIEDYEAMVDAMREPDIDTSGSISERQEELINGINFMLNGCNHKFEHVLFVKPIEGEEMQCERVLYRENRLWVEQYLYDEDCWEQQDLTGVTEDSLDDIYKMLIDELL